MLTYVPLGHAILRLKGFKTGEQMGWIAGATLAGMLVTIVIQLSLTNLKTMVYDPGG